MPVSSPQSQWELAFSSKQSGRFPDAPPLHCDLIVRLSYVMSVLDEVCWRLQRKSMTDPLWHESVSFTKKTQIIVPVIEDGDFALMNPWPRQQASDAVVTLRAVSSVGQVASGFEQLLNAEGLNFDPGLRTFDEGLMHRDLPVCVALHGKRTANTPTELQN